MNTLRQFLAYGAVCVFLIFIFSSGITWHVESGPDLFTTKNGMPSIKEVCYYSIMVSAAFTGFPDFSQYNNLRTLSKKEYPIGAS
jgi:hypothetical protein